MAGVNSPDPASAVDVLPGGGVFDPLARFYIAGHARPQHVAPVALPALTPFQRALLAIDGTVTQFIEAWALEPVTVQRIGQRDERLDAAEPWLGLDAGAPVIRRRVLLCGAQSGRFYAWADSLIAAGRIEARMRGALDLQGGGIGRILIEAGLESRREALWYGREGAGSAPAVVTGLWSGDFLLRSYRVLVAGQPLMLITERFPL